MDDNPREGSERRRRREGGREERGEESGEREGGMLTHHSAFDANTKMSLRTEFVTPDRTGSRENIHIITGYHCDRLKEEESKGTDCERLEESHPTTWADWTRWRGQRDRADVTMSTHKVKKKKSIPLPLVIRCIFLSIKQRME